MLKRFLNNETLEFVERTVADLEDGEVAYIDPCYVYEDSGYNWFILKIGKIFTFTYRFSNLMIKRIGDRVIINGSTSGTHIWQPVEHEYKRKNKVMYMEATYAPKIESNAITVFSNYIVPIKGEAYVHKYF